MSYGAGGKGGGWMVRVQAAQAERLAGTPTWMKAMAWGSTQGRRRSGS